MSLSVEAMRDLAAEIIEDLGIPAGQQPSTPRPEYGAPNIGLGWADPESRPAAWRAFGEA